MAKRTRFTIIVALVSAIIIPAIALAELAPACGGPNEKMCTLCDLFSYAKTTTNYIVLTIAPLIAVLAFSIGGFKILMSGANPGLRQEGMKAIRNGVIGLLIVFSAWIIISEFLLFFVGSKGSMPWNEIECIPQVEKKEEKVIAPPVTGPAYDEYGVERAKLLAAGIGVKKNYCSDFDKPLDSNASCCTTVAQLPNSAINGLITLKNECSTIIGTTCTLFVAGGTEKTCHTSHGPGNPVVDVAVDGSFNFYMFQKAGNENNFTLIKKPNLCARAYTISGISTAWLEYDNSCTKPDHWHLVF